MRNDLLTLLAALLIVALFAWLDGSHKQENLAYLPAPPQSEAAQPHR